jgi:DNA repair exonuclease SbcCD ATPase subunit
MTIKLESIMLRNFKGVRDLTLTLSGRDAIVSGPNGAGKTTIVDAFLWLLFSKDSEDRGQFEVKTLDSKNKPIHNLEHKVEAVLVVDGKRVTLRKLLKEIWTKPRGKAQQEFSGHTTDYWINEEPVKAKEYQVFIDNLIDVEKFRLITNPLYFSTKLHWEKRRETLLRICGEISADAIIAAGGADLEGLEELLGDRTVSAVKKVVSDKRKMANDELEKIPAQIDAVSRTLPTLLDDYAPVQEELEDCHRKVTELDAQMQNASKALEPIREKGRELGRLEQEQAGLLSKLERDTKNALDDNRRRNEQVETELKVAESNLVSVLNQLSRSKAQKAEAEALVTKLRAEYEEEFRASFAEPSADELVCNSCGQNLPTEKRDEMISNARNRFDTKRTDAIASVTARGHIAKDALDELTAEIEETEKQYSEALSLRDRKKNICELNRMAEENTKPAESVDHTKNPEYIALGVKITALRAELDTPVDDDTGTISVQRRAVNERIEELVNKLSERDAFAKSNKVIEELTARERELSDLIAEYDGQLFMLEEYIRLEAELLEGNINAQFKTLSFKLFKEQINGGLTPTCEALIDGVPFSEANTAGQFNAGMEIIDTLCKLYEVNAPVFVDRCESINVLTPIESQVIRMVVVNENDMALALGMPGIITTKAARGDITIKTTEKETA